MVQQRDLVLRLDDAGVGHQLLPVDNVDALPLQREQNRRLHDVHAQRLLQQAAHLELDANLLRHVLGAAHLRRHRAAQQRNARARAVAQPRAVELVVPGRRSEIPQDRLVILRQQREAADLVLRPRADVRGRDVAHVVHVEAQQRAHRRRGKARLDSVQALAPQPVEIDALLPIHRHRAIGFQRHDLPPGSARLRFIPFCRTVPTQPERPPAPTAPWHLRAAAKKESARASRRCASPAHPGYRTRPARSPRQSRP